MEPPILDLLPVIKQNLDQCVVSSKNTVFDKYLQDNLELINQHLQFVTSALSPEVCKDMLRLVIHCDYHPGNLKFEGDQPVALFDFDWSKVDMRVFDVGHACFYFFTNWDQGQDGVLLLDDLEIYIDSYQQFLANSKILPPLTRLEIEYFPHMLAASNLYILNWTILDYLNKPVDPEEYLMYLSHDVNLVKWLSQEQNWHQFTRRVKEVGQ
jgi:homoserine kinase type II